MEKILSSKKDFSIIPLKLSYLNCSKALIAIIPILALLVYNVIRRSLVMLSLMKLFGYL